MNKYLEKVASMEKQALNALKARAMAHEAGVVVDPNTQWKWALRQFRGQRGELVQGKERGKVLNRIMGNPEAGHNNFVQAIQSEQRKVHPTDEVQLRRYLGDKVVPRRLVRHMRATHIGGSNYIGEYRDSDLLQGLEKAHTPLDSVIRNHNRVSYQVKGVVPGEKAFRSENEVVKGSASSGTEEIIHEPLHNRQLNNTIDTHVHPRGARRIVRMRNPSYVPDRYKPEKAGYSDAWFRRTGEGYTSVSPSGGYYRGSDGSLIIREGGDIKAFASHGNIGIPHNIVSGRDIQGKVFLGSHRVIPTRYRKFGMDLDKPERVRSAYLDLTPRKVRPANPYLDKLHEMGKTL